MRFPPDLLESSDFKRRLFSGLTSSIELITEVNAGGGNRLHYSLIEIRYEVWEEQLLIRIIEGSGSPNTLSFKSLDNFKQWLVKNPIVVANLLQEERGKPLKVKLSCRIIPFSRSEQLQTKDWFAKLIKVPDAARRGQSNRSRQRNVEGSNNNVFQLLMSSGIDRSSVLTWQWKWALAEVH